MTCTKCKQEAVPGAVFCPFCGRRLVRPARKPRSAPNGAGCAFRRGSGWVAQAVVGYRELPDDLQDPSNAKQRIPIKRTKAGFSTKAEALAYIPKLKNAVEQSTLTLQQVYDAWEKWYSPRVDPSTMAGYRAAYHYFGALAGRRICLITAGELQDCMDDCPKGKRTHQNMKVVAGLIWKYAKSKHIVSQVDTEILYTGKGQSKKREALTDIEVEKIRKAMDTDRYADYIFSLCYLGYRPGEMLELRKDQVIEHQGRLFLVEGKKTDAGRNRTVPVHQKIEPIIRSRMHVPGTDLIFPQYCFTRASKEQPVPLFTGFKQMSDNYFREMVFKPLCARLGIAEGKVPYAARHTFSNMLKTAEGADIDKARLIGHSDYTFTQTKYQTTDLDELAAVVDSIK